MVGYCPVILSIVRPILRNLVRSLPAAVVFLVGCTVPLGPGFHHSGRRATVEEVSPPPQTERNSALLHMRITDQLENIGIGNLPYLDVTMPEASVFGLKNLSIQANGRDVRFTPVNSLPASPLRLEFPSWAPGGNRSVTFSYDLDPGPSASGGVAATPTDFYVADPAAFPAWLPPAGVFVKADAQASYRTLEIVLPPGFRVLAAGREQRIAKGSSSVRSFRVTPADFPMFVVSGKYQEQIIKAQNRDVIFWTLEPLDAQTARSVAERLSATASTLRQIFGSVVPETYGRDRSAAAAVWPIRIVETSAQLLPTPEAQLQEATAAFSATSFPQGVLLDQAAFARGLSTEPVLELAEYELARTWFGWHVRIPKAQSNLLGDGAGLYGVIAAAGARRRTGRRREIAQLIAAYDREQAKAVARSQRLLAQPVINYASAERVMDSYKAALFFVALADLAGKRNFEEAMQRLVRDMAGRQVEDEDLRSALEAATGKNLAEMFRMWIGGQGIPDDFRAHYRTE